MSYFPSGDIPTPPSSSSSHPSCFGTTSLHQQQQEWTDFSETSGYTLSTPQQTLYTTDSSRGLGLFSLPVTTVQAYLEMGMTNDRLTSSVPLSWPSQLSTAQAPMAHPPPVHLQYWNDTNNDSLPTVTPQDLWNHAQPSAPRSVVYDASPAPSHHSPASYQSVVSTPYARSDSVLRSAGSPQVKVESDAKPSVPQIHFIPQVVEPKDLFAEPSTPPEVHSDRETSYVPSPSPAASDYKPLAVRPPRRRAFSSESLLDDRKKRGYTSSEKATCSCDQCGKLFQRTYNLRAHMETHDPHRAQPHECSYGLCSKRFVRRTDLVRHEQSVHLKERNHVCLLCNSSFARKDTLRRHVDDGCPKRIEVRKRTPKARRASISSTTRKSPQHYKREESPLPSWAWEDIPELA